MVVESVVVEVAVGKVRSVEEVETITAMHHTLCIASSFHLLKKTNCFSSLYICMTMKHYPLKQ